ncbi:hypothetical protein [Millisia brevis]|uniref:hypothetical protein n=1 Tax=Millisia brevis TaxID=264148 RepID=UPI0008362FBA|nr:hypothetical protein [Millisia brevis]
MSDRGRRALRGGLFAGGALVVLGGLAIVVIWIFRAVVFADVVDRFEGFRVASPDHVLDAVIFESAAVIDTSIGYDVHIVPAGQFPPEGQRPAARLHGALRTGDSHYGTYGLHVHWPDDSSVVVEYLAVDSIPIEPVEPIEVGGRMVRVILIDGVADSPE